MAASLLSKVLAKKSTQPKGLLPQAPSTFIHRGPPGGQALGLKLPLSLWLLHPPEQLHLLRLLQPHLLLGRLGDGDLDLLKVKAKSITRGDPTVLSILSFIQWLRHVKVSYVPVAVLGVNKNDKVLAPKEIPWNGDTRTENKLTRLQHRAICARRKVRDRERQGSCSKWEGPGGLAEDVRVGRHINAVKEQAMQISRSVLIRGNSECRGPEPGVSGAWWGQRAGPWLERPKSW